MTGTLVSGVVLVLSLFLSTPAWAFDLDSRPEGLGIMVGEPTGISAKYWRSRSQAIQGGVSYSRRREFVQVHVDYLWTVADLLERRKRREAGPGAEAMGMFPIYAGAGGRIGVRKDDLVAGARVPIGLSYLFHRIPVDIFLEIVPGVTLVPETEFDLEGGLGARYYF